MGQVEVMTEKCSNCGYYVNNPNDHFVDNQWFCPVMKTKKDIDDIRKTGEDAITLNPTAPTIPINSSWDGNVEQQKGEYQERYQGYVQPGQLASEIDFAIGGLSPMKSCVADRVSKMAEEMGQEIEDRLLEKSEFNKSALSSAAAFLFHQINPDNPFSNDLTYAVSFLLAVIDDHIKLLQKDVK